MRDESRHYVYYPLLILAIFSQTSLSYLYETVSYHKTSNTCMSPGITIPADGYLIVAKNPANSANDAHGVCQPLTRASPRALEVL